MILLRRLLFIVYILLPFAILAESIEQGFVKEYRGASQKKALPGVELNVKGAQSTVSGADGAFELKFAILEAGDKVDYTEIYKSGFVIFNKDALDAWRISNKKRPFTIVMCREADFRELKKKFYGIIEQSYRAEYERQAKLAAEKASDAMSLKTQLDLLKKDYEEKLANINTYVELFARIDRSEMDSIEARTLEYVEAGRIDDAIKIYEELQLSRQLDEQMGKWRSGKAMVEAGEGMLAESQADMALLAEKMQKQLGLYQMGGEEYRAKRIEMTEALIKLLYHLNEVDKGHYNELLGEWLCRRAFDRDWGERMPEYREAAALPSTHGLVNFADCLEFRREQTPANADTIRHCYNEVLRIGVNDSLSRIATKRLEAVPDTFYTAADGTLYPYKRIGDDKAALTGWSNYYSAHIEGDAVLPSAVDDGGKRRTVVAVNPYAFNDNFNLKSVRLPDSCRLVGERAFYHCPNLKASSFPRSIESVNDQAFEIHSQWFFPEGISRLDVAKNRLLKLYEHKEPATATKNMLHEVLADRYYEIAGPRNGLLEIAQILNNHLAVGDTATAISEALRLTEKRKPFGRECLGQLYALKGDYPQALKWFEAAAKGKNYDGYNCLANAYAQAEYGICNFKKAYKLIDKAIENAETDFDLCNYLDTRGQFLLLEDKTDEARAVFDRIMGVDSLHYEKTYSTKLSERFAPSAKAVHANVVETEIDVFDRDVLYVAMMVGDSMRARLKRSKCAIPDSVFDMYLDEATMGCLLQYANQSTKTKLVNLINYIEANVFVALRKYSKENGLQFGSEDFGLLDLGNSEQLESNSHIQILALQHYSHIYQSAVCRLLSPVWMKELHHWVSAIVYFCTNQPKDKQAFWTDLLIEGHDASYFRANYAIKPADYPTKMDMFISSLNDGFVKMPETDFYLTGSDKVDTYKRRADECIAKLSTKKATVEESALKRYVYTASLMAKVEHSVFNIENFRNVDYEELVSIGILAVQVLVKNKTPEQLAKYNDIYIATAVRWAIRNELRIRYPWYRLKNFDDDRAHATEYADKGMDYQTAMVRETVYETFKLMYYQHRAMSATPLDFVVDDKSRERVGEYIETTWNAIQRAIKQMPDAERAFAEEFFAEESKASDVVRRHSVVAIQNAFNHIREELNRSGEFGY